MPTIVNEEEPQEPEAVEEVADQVEAEEYDSRKMDPEETLWEGGPNFAQINAWKDQFGDVYVTSVTPDRHIIWRVINRHEYRTLVKTMEAAIENGMSPTEANMNNEEAIAELCILFPKYSRHAPADEMGGLASTISQQVMDASAFVALEVRQL